MPEHRGLPEWKPRVSLFFRISMGVLSHLIKVDPRIATEWGLCTQCSYKFLSSPKYARRKVQWFGTSSGRISPALPSPSSLSPHEA